MSRTDRRRYSPLRSGLVAGAGLVLALLAVQVPQAALATDPVNLGGAYVVDRVGVVGNRAAEVQDALDELSQTEDTNLFVVYVDSFTGVADREAWADDTAVRNDLGVNDVLLAVATEDRLYQVSVDPDFVLTDAQLSELESTAIQPSLRQNDWAGAAINTATGLGELIRGESVSDPVITPGEAQPAAGSGSSLLTLVLGGTVVVVGGVVGAVYLRKRSKSRSGAAQVSESGPSQLDLDREVDRLLVQLDDAVTSSEQELGFAVAQFGDDATATFVQALASAKEKVRQSFALKQKLDDRTPDSHEDTRAWSLKIIELCTSAEAELDAQADAFVALRELEKNPQPALEAIATAVAATRQRLPAGTAALQAMSNSYSPGAVATVADNPAQADRLLSYADATAAAVPGLIAEGRPSEAAVSIQRAQAAVAQADGLVASIHTLQTSLDNASRSVSAAVAEASSDVAEARRLLESPEGAARNAELAPLISAVDAAVARASAAGVTDPLAELQVLQSANAPLDAALAEVRDTAVRLARTREVLARTLVAASSTINAVKEFVVSRRGVVSVEARTRIAEAERLLAEAYSLQETDPERALTQAGQANRYAQAAEQASRSEVDAYGRYSDQYGDSGIDGSAMLGGLLGGLLSGNGSSQRSYSGGMFGGSSSWGGGSRSSGSSRSSSSSRSSGSRRSSSSSRSGGRRGGGGRF
jgi:uncharacterized membrane protein YgcG